MNKLTNVIQKLYPESRHGTKYTTQQTKYMDNQKVASKNMQGLYIQGTRKSTTQEVLLIPQKTVTSSGWEGYCNELM